MLGDNLPKDWKWVTLEDIQHPDKRAIVSGPFGSNIGSRFFVSSGVPVIRGNNLTADMTRYVDDGYVFLTKEKAKEFKNCEAYANDLIFTAAGTLGQVGIIPPDAKYPRYIISNKQMRVRVDENRILPLYAYYWLASSEMVEYIKQRNTGSSVPLINLSVLRKLPIPLAPLSEQKEIIRVLSALDDKIELNRRMNQTLEAMAQALFKSWFVDFDPVTAKLALSKVEGAEGRAPFGMSAETAALFPAEFVDSELGAIPKGWHYVPMGEVMVNFDSRRIPVSGAQRLQRQGIYPYYGAASVMDYIDDYLFDGVYLLVGEDGSVTDKVGMAVTQYVWGKFWVNNHAHVLQGRNGICTEHILMHYKFEPLLPYVTGAVQPKLNQANMNSMQFLMPSKEVAEAYSKTIVPWFALIRSNFDEIKTLASIRDALLPRLLSGEVRVSEL